MAALNTDALYTRVGEIILSGSGTSPYTITAGSFTMDWWYQDREPPTLATHLLTKPQVRLELIRMTDAKAWPRPSNQTMYNIEFNVNLAYYTEAKLLRTAQAELAKTIGNDIHIISKALQHPNNLRATDAGALTGLGGGLLEMQDEDVNFEFDSEASVVVGELNFTGFLVLSSST